MELVFGVGWVFAAAQILARYQGATTVRSNGIQFISSKVSRLNP